MIITPGATSQTITIQIVDDSGLGVTGLLAATFPATSYTRVTEAAVAITLVDLAAITSAYSSGGVKEISGGYYRLDVPDAMSATATKARVIGEATNKHILYPPITISYIAGNAVQLNGAGQTARDIGASVVAASVTGVTFPATVPSLVQIQGGLPTDTSIATDVQTGLTAQGYTTGRAVFLDTLNGLVAAIWNVLTSTLTTAGSIGKRLNDFVTTLVYAAPTTPPTVVQVRQEMDSNSTQLAAIVTGVAGVPNAVLDLANGIETSMTLRQAMRALVAMGAGKSTETAGTLVFKRQDGTTTAFTIVHDSLGSRTGSSIGSL